MADELILVGGVRTLTGHIVDDSEGEVLWLAYKELLEELAAKIGPGAQMIHVRLSVETLVPWEDVDG